MNVAEQQIQKISILWAIPELKKYMPNWCCFKFAEATWGQLPADIRINHILKNILYLHILKIFIEDLQLLHESGSCDLLRSIAKFEKVIDADTLTEVLKIGLTKPGASFDKLFNDRGSILHYACESKELFFNAIKIIIKAGGGSIPSLLFHKDGMSRNALDTAVIYRSKEIAELFINAVKDNEGDPWTLLSSGWPLHCAAKSGNKDLIMLIIQTADAYGKVKDLFLLRNSAGYTAREILENCRSKKDRECAKFLQELEEHYCSEL